MEWKETGKKRERRQVMPYSNLRVTVWSRDEWQFHPSLPTCNPSKSKPSPRKKK
jgi:hypothetical protein